MKAVDNFLNRITMYRLVLYGLIAMLAFAFAFSVLRLLPFSPSSLVFSTLFLVFFSGQVNDIFSRVFDAPVNNESATITALILALIIVPAKSLPDYVLLGWVAVLAMASKYIFAVNKKHLLNPAAAAVTLTALFLNRPADWWVGTTIMAPVVLAIGFLIVRKTRREDMVIAFILTAVTAALLQSVNGPAGYIQVFTRLFLSSSLLFFAFIMFTEPATMPPTRNLQYVFAFIVGVLFVPQTHIGGFFFSPEQALLIGNLYAYLVSPKDKLILKASEKIKLTSDTYDFIFPLQKKPAFVPGQYMEWTLPHAKQDDRGNRRYFTIASSPTENTLRLGIKFYKPASSFKQALLETANPTIVGSLQAGDFTLPSDRERKLVFMAGGIGVTPFRSIIKYLSDMNEKRDIIMFYSNKSRDEIVYADVFDEAVHKLDIKIIYTLTDREHAPSDWQGETGRVSSDMIRKYVPDYHERRFYISGPHAMVSGFESVLRQMGIKDVKTDFFPGFV